MIRTEKTPIADADLPVEAFKDHLRLGTGFSDESLQDPVLRGFLRAAIVAVEGRIGRICSNVSLILKSQNWPLIVN